MNTKQILLAILIGSISVAPVSAKNGWWGGKPKPAPKKEMTAESKWERERADYERQLAGITNLTMQHPYVLEDAEFKKHLDNATRQAEVGAYLNATIYLNTALNRMQRVINDKLYN